MQEYLLNEEATEQIEKTFQLISDLVVPTMGAKGLLAGIDNGFGQPNLTDDGVTVAKALNNLSGWDRTIAKSIIEAAHNTEAEAFDGTTLTVLMTSLLYNEGRKMVSDGMHPRNAVDRINETVQQVLKDLDDSKIEMDPAMVRDVATIATKIPEMGRIIEEAYSIVGKSMDVLVEWDRASGQTSVRHDNGYTIPGGYMSPALAKLPGQLENAKIALIKTGLSTEPQIKQWLGSIPAECPGVIYIVSPTFNPEGMRRIINWHSENQIKFNFVFVGTHDVDDIMMDISALTDAKIQDPSYGIKNYKYEMTGEADYIQIEKNKTILRAPGNIEDRVKYYEDILEEKKYASNSSQKMAVEKKLASLQHGIATIKIAVPTEAAFSTIKLKLDDAKGAVHTAFKYGVVLGGGKALHNIAGSTIMPKVFKTPFETILKNAGIQQEDYEGMIDQDKGIDVTTKSVVNLKEAGIIDSLASIKQALINASSIATSYLTVYMLIKEKPKD